MNCKKIDQKLFAVGSSGGLSDGHVANEVEPMKVHVLPPGGGIGHCTQHVNRGPFSGCSWKKQMKSHARPNERPFNCKPELTC